MVQESIEMVNPSRRGSSMGIGGKRDSSASLLALALAPGILIDLEISWAFLHSIEVG